MLALAAFDGKVAMDSCFAARASPRTLFRWVKRLEDEGHFRPREHSDVPARKMNEDDALFLWCWTMAFPEVMRDEAQVALQMFRGVTVSLPTISREWQRLQGCHDMVLCIAARAIAHCLVVQPAWSRTERQSIPRHRRRLPRRSSVSR